LLLAVALAFLQALQQVGGPTVAIGAGPDQLTKQLIGNPARIRSVEPRRRAAGWFLALGGRRGSVGATDRAQLLEALQLRESKLIQGSSSVVAVTGGDGIGAGWRWRRAS